MTTNQVQISFVVGSRKILAVSRTLQTVSFGLDQLLGGGMVQFPKIDGEADGLRVLSAPAAAVSGIMDDHPGYLIGGLQLYRRYYIEMEGRSYEDYLAGFSSKTRSTLNRKRRKLAEHARGPLDVRTFHKEAEVETFVADAVPLSRRTYQARLLDSGLPEGEDAIASMKALAREDRFRAYLLYVGNKVVSYLYVPTTNGIISYAYLGYVHAFTHLSVGTVLQMEALERLFAEQRYRYFDFTEGEGAHKQMFGTGSVAAATFFVLKPSVSNRLLINSLNIFDSGVAMAKRLAKQSGRLAQMRRVLRG